MPFFWGGGGELFSFYEDKVFYFFLVQGVIPQPSPPDLIKKIPCTMYHVPWTMYNVSYTMYYVLSSGTMVTFSLMYYETFGDDLPSCLGIANLFR